MLNALSVDVEDYYQVSAFEQIVGFDQWEAYESRVTANTIRVLEILAEGEVKGTFFVLGWVAERFPEIVRRIHEAGHEVATHGYAHKMISDQTPQEFALDLKKSITIIEDITGDKVLGHRAASFSVVKTTLWAIDIMREQGLRYDSSIFPIIHDRYGIPEAPRHPYQIKEGFWEFPMSTVKILGKNLPIAGGGYFRLFPYWLTKWGMERVNKEGQPVLVYVHPWEFDPGQPRIKGSMTSRFRHYTNLDKTADRLRKLCCDFRFAPIREVLQLEGYCDRQKSGTIL